MWLKAKVMNTLLAANKITRFELAKEVRCSLHLLGEVLNGKNEADEELSRLLIAAFGAAAMMQAIDWRRMTA